MNSRISRRLVCSVGLAVVLCCVLGTCKSSSPESTAPGATEGTILVGSPQVTKREHLINDRLAEERWLRQQLEKTDEQVFGYEGAVNFLGVQSFTSATTVQADPMQLQMYKAQTEAYLESLRRSGEISQLQYNLQEAILTKQLEQVNNGTWVPATPTPVGTPPMVGTIPTPPSLPAVGPTPGQGGSGSALALLATPVPTVPSLGKVGASPVDLFRDRQAYREEIRTAIIENGLDDRHDLGGNTLYRLNFDATVVPGRDTSQWGIVGVRVSNGAGSSEGEKAKLYEAWVTDLENFLNDQVARWALSFSPDQHSDPPLRVLRLMSASSSSNVLECDCPATVGHSTTPSEGSQRPFATPEQNRRRTRTPQSPTGRAEPTRVAADFRAYTISTLQVQPSFPADPMMVKSLKEQLSKTAASLATLRGRIPEEELWEMVARGVVREYRDYFGLGEVVQLCQDNGRITATKQVRIPERFAKLVPSSEATHTGNVTASQVWAYAVTPRELAQRISEVTARRDTTQLSLSLGVLLKVVGIQQFLDYTKANQLLMEGIKRQPLVVGFSGDSVSCGDSPCNLGWLLGPRFRVSAKADAAEFRQATTPDSLAALVSVPSWWTSATVEVCTGWVADAYSERPRPEPRPWGTPSAYTTPVRGTKTYELTVPSSSCASYRIGLPGQTRHLTEALATRSVREPSVFRTVAGPLVPGTTGSVLLEGDELWRSPEVTLGSQRADSIYVLPTMQAIIATFNRIDALPPGKTSEKRSLNVWTYEGAALGGDVEVGSGGGSAAGGTGTGAGIEAIAVPQRRLVRGGDVVVEVTKGSVPVGYQKLEIGLKPHGGTGPFQRFEVAAFGDGERKLSARVTGLADLPAFKDLLDGAMVDVAVLITPRPGLPELVVPARTPVYLYRDDAAMKVAVSPLTYDKTKTFVDVTLTFPRDAELAFLGFSLANVKLEVETDYGTSTGFPAKVYSQERKDDRKKSFRITLNPPKAFKDTDLVAFHLKLVDAGKDDLVLGDGRLTPAQ